LTKKVFLYILFEIAVIQLVTDLEKLGTLTFFFSTMGNSMGVYTIYYKKSLDHVYCIHVL
jgi:hypothetical protein